MALALIVSNFLSAIALVAAILAGLGSAYDILPMTVHLRTHVLLAIFAAFLVLLCHSMTMFYFIGTGIRMKELVEEHAITEADLVYPTKRFKAKVFPFATMALLFTMVTFILGGGVDRGQLPGWVHLGFAVIAVALHFVAIQKEAWAIHANVALFDRLDAILEAREQGVPR